MLRQNWILKTDYSLYHINIYCHTDCVLTPCDLIRPHGVRNLGNSLSTPWHFSCYWNQRIHVGETVFKSHTVPLKKSLLQISHVLWGSSYHIPAWVFLPKHANRSHGYICKFFMYSQVSACRSFGSMPAPIELYSKFHYSQWKIRCTWKCHLHDGWDIVLAAICW